MRDMKRISIKRASGFTLIELVLVIVIIGIIAAISLPKYVDLTTSAKNTELINYAVAIRTASTQNYILYKSGLPNYIPVNDPEACTIESFNRFLSTPLPSYLTAISWGPTTGSCLPRAGGSFVTTCAIRYTNGAAVTQVIRVSCTN